MNKRILLSAAFLVVSALLLAVLVNGYSIFGFTVFWIIGLLALGGVVSAFHHRKAHQSFATDALLLASSFGLAALGSVLILMIVGVLLSEGSLQPHFLIALVTVVVGFAGLFVLQFSYVLHASRHMLVRSLIGSGVLALFAVVAVQIVFTVVVNEQAAIAFAYEPESTYDPEYGGETYALIENTPLSDAIISLRSDLHGTYENTLEPLHSCSSWLIDTVWCFERVVDSIIGTVDLVIVEQTIMGFIESSSNTTVDSGAVLDASDRVLLEEIANDISPLFDDAQSNAERIRERKDRGSLDDTNMPDDVLSLYGSRSAMTNAMASVVFATTYGSSLRDLIDGVQERTYVYGISVALVAPALLAESDPSLLDDPLFVTVTRDRIEKHREGQ